MDAIYFYTNYYINSMIFIFIKNDLLNIRLLPKMNNNNALHESEWNYY